MPFISKQTSLLDKRDVWCRITFWSKGHRFYKETTPKIFLPMTYDPCFKSESKIKIKDPATLPSISIVIKVIPSFG